MRPRTRAVNDTGDPPRRRRHSSPARARIPRWSATTPRHHRKKSDWRSNICLYRLGVMDGRSAVAPGRRGGRRPPATPLRRRTPGWRAGHGEFRGLEFLEVRAQRIINGSPPPPACPSATRSTPTGDAGMPALLLCPADPRVPEPRHRRGLRPQDRGEDQRRGAGAGGGARRSGGPANRSPWGPTPIPTSAARGSTGSPGGSSRCWAGPGTRSRS